MLCPSYVPSNGSSLDIEKFTHLVVELKADYVWFLPSTLISNLSHKLILQPRQSTTNFLYPPTLQKSMANTCCF